MKKLLLLVFSATLMLFLTNNSYSQGILAKAGSDQELVQAMNNPNVSSIEITQDGYYESIQMSLKAGTSVAFTRDNGMRANCTLSVEKTDICFDGDWSTVLTNWTENVATASTAGTACPTQPNGTSDPTNLYGWSYAYSAGYGVDGTLVWGYEGSFTGTGVMTDRWDFDAQFEVDRPGIYTLTYKWNALDLVTSQVVFFERPTVTLSTTNPTACEEIGLNYAITNFFPAPVGDSDPTITWVVADGGTPAVTATIVPTATGWNFDPTAYPSLASCGDYTVTLTASNDFGDCPTEKTTSFYIYDKPAGVTAGADQPEVCAVGSIMSTSLSGSFTTVSCDNGTPPSVLWTQTGGAGTAIFTTDDANSTDVSVDACGTYEFTYTVTNGALNGCSTSSSTTVTFYDLPTLVNAGTPQSVCEDSNGDFLTTLSGTFTNSSCGGTNDVAWTQYSGPGTAAITNETTLTPSIDAPQPGTYVFQMDVTNGSNCTVSSTVTVDFYDLATNVNAGADQEVCEDSNGDFATTVEGSYTISSYGTNAVAWSVSPSSTGLGTIYFGSPSADLTTVTSTACGEYILDYTVTTGGPTTCEVVSSTTIYFYDLPENVSAGADQEVCETTPGSNVYSTSVTGSYTDGLCGANTVLWSSTDPEIYFTSSTANTTTVTSTACGDYTLNYTVTSGGLQGCSTTSSTTIHFYELAENVSAGADQEVCETTPGGDDYSATLVGSYDAGTCGANTVLWSVSSISTGAGTIDFATPTANSTTITSTACGEYILDYTVTSGGLSGCSTTSSTTVYFYDLPENVIAGTPQDVCEVAGVYSTTLAGTFDAVSCDNGTAPAVAWTKVSGPGSVEFTPDPNYPGDPNKVTVTATAITTGVACGSYVFAFEVTNGSDCSVSNTVAVDFYDLPDNVAITADAKVCGYSTNLIGAFDVACDNGGTPTMEWTIAPASGGTATTTGFGTPTVTNTTLTVLSCGEYVITYTVTNLSGCETTSSTNIIFYETPDILVEQGTPTGDVYTCSTVTYSVSNVACGTDLWDYDWQVSGGTFSGDFTATSTVTINWDATSGVGAGTVTCTASTIGLSGCEDTDVLSVDLIRPTLEGQVKYWNAFETYMPSPFPTNLYGTYPQDYFYVSLYIDGTDDGNLFGTYYVEPNLMVDEFGNDISLMSYFGFDLATSDDYTCSSVYYLKVWDGGLVYHGDPAPPAEETVLGASYTYNNWGGVNATDALGIQMMAARLPVAAWPWVGDKTFEPAYGYYSQDIANVNNSDETGSPLPLSGISSLDALTAKYRAVGLLSNYPDNGTSPNRMYSPNFVVTGRKVTSLPASTWDTPFNTPTNIADVPFAHSGNEYMYFQAATNHKYTSEGLPWDHASNYINLYYEAVGDINASYVPTSAGFKAEPTIELNYEGLSATNVDDVMTIPVAIDRNAELGAISLFFNYRNDLIEVLGTNFSDDDVFINHEQGILNIAWFDMDAIEVNAEEAIALIKVRVLAQIPANTELFSLNMNTELADATATPIADINLKTIGVTTDKSAVNFDDLTSINYPNPFKNSTTISYTLPEAGNVTVEVYNSLGMKVKTLFSGLQGAGSQRVVFNTDNALPGVYFYHITVQGETKDFSTVKRMIVTH